MIEAMETNRDQSTDPDPSQSTPAWSATEAGDTEPATAGQASPAWSAAEAGDTESATAGQAPPVWPAGEALDAESSAAQQVPPALPRGWRIHRLFRQTLYLLVSFPVAIASFSVLTTLVPVSAGTIMIWVGVPLLAVTVQVAIGFAAFERYRLGRAGYVLAGLPSEPKLPTQGRLITWLKESIFSASGWRAVLHGILVLPTSIFTFTIVVTWWFMIIFGLTEWIWRPLVPYDTCIMTVGSCEFDGTFNNLVDILNLPFSQVVFDLGIGLIALATLIPVTHAMSLLHSGLARAFLAPTDKTLQQRLRHLAESRAQANEAQANELRRLERDIHDGPQQRLIRVGMDLAAAQRRLEDGDQAAADQLIAQARQMSEEAVGELRALSRGIAPPILADRGLAVALEAALAASAVPATLDLSIAPQFRLPAAVETVLYFTVTEALANVAKHAGANQVTVHLSLDGQVARLVVDDDGTGGAQIVPGHGLANLAARASAIDGSFEVTSVEGQGTRVVVEVPLADESGVG